MEKPMEIRKNSLLEKLEIMENRFLSISYARP